MSLAALIALLTIAPTAGLAQVGRSFTAVETYVAVGESVRVGKITKLEQIEYDKPLVGEQGFGKPYRLKFTIEETIRGKKAKQIELVLALQDSRFLEYMREHGSVVLMVGGQNRFNADPSPEIGVEEDGQRVDGHWYQFLFLDAPTKADRQKDPDLVKQIAITYNEGRMFTIDLRVVQGRQAILKRARAFVITHKEKDETVWLRVPNAFGQLVGYSNAFCGIALPVCPETERNLISLLKNPKLILDRIPPQGDWEKSVTVVEALKCLKPFPSKANSVLVRRFLGDYDPASVSEEVRSAPTHRVQQAAWDLLESWKK